MHLTNKDVIYTWTQQVSQICAQFFTWPLLKGTIPLQEKQHFSLQNCKQERSGPKGYKKIKDSRFFFMIFFPQKK